MSQQISNPLALLGIIKNRLVESVIGRRNKQALEYRNKVGYCMSYGTTWVAITHKIMATEAELKTVFNFGWRPSNLELG